MQQSRVLIIGGGAAGLTASIAAARRGAAVTLLEAGSRVGRKILASGNGRCNLTNLNVSPEAFNHPDFVEPVLRVYPYEAIRSFFGGLGLHTYADDEGRVYPLSNSASSVLDVLRLECDHLGVEVRYGFEAGGISKNPGSTGFTVSAHSGEAVIADTVIVATGGGDSLLTDIGHQSVEMTPVLGPVRTDTLPIRGLSGVRVRCAVTVLADIDADGTGGDPVATERGELLFRDYGVSGIVIFELSRYLVPDCVLSIDLFPGVEVHELLAMLSTRCAELHWRTAETFFTGMLHDRVARAILRAADISMDTPVEELSAARLAGLLKDFRLNVTGVGDARQSQVMRGGALVAEFDPYTMESRRLGGLFAAGEALDIDGRSGGFNLHWAWASGIVAGEAAARQALAHVGTSDADPGSPA